MKSLLTLSLLALLAGCQTAPMTTPADRPAGLHSWDLSGRLGYRAGDDGGSASVDWQQRNERGELAFSGPLGMGSALIRWQPGHAVRDTGKERIEAANSTELAWRLTGLMLPVEALQYWVRGLPWPVMDGTPTFNELGQLTALQQAGWTLDFDRYGAVDGLQLPFRIRARQGDQRFTLIVKNWEPLP